MHAPDHDIPAASATDHAEKTERVAPPSDHTTDAGAATGEGAYRQSLPLPAVTIGPLTLDRPVLAAPLAGISNHPFRVLARRYGAGLVFTEMLKARPLVGYHDKLERLLRHEDVERPVGIQLAASDPDEAQRAAALIADGMDGRLDFDAVDLNLGCPVRKIIKSRCGAYFMDKPQEVHEIYKAIAREIERAPRPIALTGKIRVGVSRQHLTAIEISKALVDAGCQAVTVHMRARADGHWGPTLDDYFARVVDAVDVPVFANGAIDSPERAEEVVRRSGCAGVMIARASFGNPWIFRHIGDHLATGRYDPTPPAVREVRDMLIWHVEETIALFGEYLGCRIARRYIPWYSRGLEGGAEFRRRAVRIESLAEFHEMVAAYFDRYDLDAPMPVAEYLPADPVRLAEPDG